MTLRWKRPLGIVMAVVISTSTWASMGRTVLNPPNASVGRDETLPVAIESFVAVERGYVSERLGREDETAHFIPALLPRPSRPPARPRSGLTLTPGFLASGVATWYAYRAGQAAAGPALRKALGRHWRGKRVIVRWAGHETIVTLTDFCRCPNGRTIDLDVRSFARLSAVSRGVLHRARVYADF